MAETDFERDLVGLMRKETIQRFANVVDTLPQYRFAVVLELLQRDDVARCLLAEALCERALAESRADAEARARYAANKGNGCEPPDEKTWDEIALAVVLELKDTPAGRAEVS